MKISPAFRLVMKAATSATARKVLNLDIPPALNPFVGKPGFKKKLRLKTN